MSTDSSDLDNQKPVLRKTPASAAHSKKFGTAGQPPEAQTQTATYSDSERKSSFIFCETPNACKCDKEQYIILNYIYNYIYECIYYVRTVCINILYIMLCCVSYRKIRIIYRPLTLSLPWLMLEPNTNRRTCRSSIMVCATCARCHFLHSAGCRIIRIWYPK